MTKTLAVTLAIATGACTDYDALSERALREHGLSDTLVMTYPQGCALRDSARTFSATDRKGATREGVVCCPPKSACYVRFLGPRKRARK